MNKLLLYSLFLSFSASAMDDLNYNRLMQMGKNGSPQAYQQAIQQSGKTPAAIIGDALQAKKQEAIGKLEYRFEHDSEWASGAPDWTEIKQLSGKRLEEVAATKAQKGVPVEYSFFMNQPLDSKIFDPQDEKRPINRVMSDVLQEKNTLPIMLTPRCGLPFDANGADSNRDGKGFIVFDPDKLNQHSESELRFIFAHELGHLWLEHDRLKEQLTSEHFGQGSYTIVKNIQQSSEMNRLSRVCELEADSCAILCHDDADVNATRDGGVFTSAVIAILNCFGYKTHTTHPSFEKRKQWAMCIKGLKEAYQKSK